MQPARYTLSTDAMRQAQAGEATIEYRLRIFEPVNPDDALVIVCTYEQPASLGLVLALAHGLRGEISHPGPWIWIHQQSSPQQGAARQRDERLRMLVLVRERGGLPTPYSRAWTPTNRAWVEKLLAQPLGPPDLISNFKLSSSTRNSKLVRYTGGF